MTSTEAIPVPPRTRILRRRIRLIVAATITYNAIEAVVAITAGTMASSAALVGFGLDSIVEVLSAVAIAWQFTRSRSRDTGTDGPARYRDLVLRSRDLRHHRRRTLVDRRP